MLSTEPGAGHYPNLIEKGERIDTIAAPAVLAAFNWAPNTERYRRLARFVDAFFGKIATLQQPPFHPKWKEVALHAPLAGWSRFRAERFRQILVNEINSVSKRANERRQPATMRPQRPRQLDIPIHASTSQ